MNALKTYRMPWLNIGTIDKTAAAADVTLGVAERDFTSASALDNVVYKVLPSPISIVEVRFVLTTNNADVDIDVWCGRLKNNKCEMTRACTLDVICGQQDYLDSTHHFADTCTVSNEYWNKAITTIEPTDCMAKLLMDMCGYDLILFHGYGTFDEDCQVELSGY